MSDPRGPADATTPRRGAGKSWDFRVDARESYRVCARIARAQQLNHAQLLPCATPTRTQTMTDPRGTAEATTARQPRENTATQLRDILGLLNYH